MRGMNKQRKMLVHWLPDDRAISACGKFVTTSVYIAHIESDVTCNTCRKQISHKYRIR